MRRVMGAGVSLAVRDEGRGHAVVLLHGFPDSSHLWRRQIPALTGAGMRAIAPDLRGLGDSDKPEEVEAYRLLNSVADVIAILDALGVDRTHVVGHDFGAVVAWLLATLHPQRVTRLVAISVGHPNTNRHRTLADREKAWYQLLFQFEGVAEDLLQRDDWRLMREWLRGDGDVDRYVESLSRPGALTAGLNWYRANLHPAAELRDRPPLPPVRMPTLAIWGSGDNYLLEDRIKRSGEFVEAEFRYERIDGASHWVQLDAPDRLNELLIGFLSASAADPEENSLRRAGPG